MDNPFGKEGNITKSPFAKVEEAPVVPVVKEEPKVDEPILAIDLKEESKPVEFKAPVKSPRQQILEEYGGLESNVPINSAYWDLKG